MRMPAFGRLTTVRSPTSKENLAKSSTSNQHHSSCPFLSSSYWHFPTRHGPFRVVDEWAVRLVAGETVTRAAARTTLLLEALAIREAQVEGVAVHRLAVHTVLRLRIREVPVKVVAVNLTVAVAQTALVPVIREISVKRVVVDRAAIQTVLLPAIREIPVEDIRVGE